jgi:hypothetical protein
MPSIKSKIMKKLNGFESFLATQGLELLREQMVNDITTYVQQGKTPLFTTGFVDDSIDALIKKLETLTLKQK